MRTFAGVSLRPLPLGFNPGTPRRLSTPPDAFQLHPSGANRASEAKEWADAAAKEVGPPGRHGGCGGAIRAAIDGFASLGADVGTAGAVIVDAQTMTPMTTGAWGDGDEWRPPFK